MNSKFLKISLAVAASIMLAACASTQKEVFTTKPVGSDYAMSGYTEGLSAYTYGGRTLLKFESDPYFLTVTDPNGNHVAFEKVGQYYRLEKALSNFTVRTGLIHVTHFTFARAKPAVPPGASKPVPLTFAVPSAQQPIKVKTQQADDLSAALSELEQQIATVRASIEHGARDAEAVERLNSKMDKIQAKLANTSSTALMVHFDLYKTGFSPKPEVANILLSVAQHAEHIKIRGRTDSVVAGPADDRIAKQRAMSAQSYLVAHGVPLSKIETTWLAAGDFVAPNTVEGKALNRRVEIEFRTPDINNLRYMNANKVSYREGQL